MAHHKLTVIGKVIGEVKHRPFDNGGAVAKFGLPVDFTRRKKNPQTGEWEGESFIIDVDVFNRDNYKLADIVRDRLKKGSLVYVEGRLRPNEYTSQKDGKVYFRPVLVADVIEFLDPRPEGMGGEGGFSEPAARSTSTRTSSGTTSRAQSSFSRGGSDFAPDEEEEAPRPSRSSGRAPAPPADEGGDDDIPF